MEVDVVVDLQFGSTAKGKVCQYLCEANRYAYQASVRVQSINAGHTVIYGGKEFKMRTIPCAWVNPTIDLVLGPGCFIENDLLLKEIAMLEEIGIKIRERLYIDYRAWVIGDEDYQSEKDAGIVDKIGSTGHAAGGSLIRKLWRTSDTRVKDDPFFDDFIVTDTVSHINKQERVLLEGCQGTMLGVHTSPYYPFATSRECSASAICAEAGISPRDVRRVFGVFRTYPIRVGGNSGLTGGEELTWEEIAKRSDNFDLVPEITTVTNRQRRIFEFSMKDLEHAIQINKPTHLCLTFLDYLNAADEGVKKYENLSPQSRSWITSLESHFRQKVYWISTGKKPEAYISIY